MRRFSVLIGFLCLVVGFVGACSSSSGNGEKSSASSSVSASPSASAGTSAPHGSTPGNHNAGAGSWDANGNPVNGGPRGADGSTGNNLTRTYCATHQDPGCPAGSYVAPRVMPNPNGQGNLVPCEGTICTNPNHGAGTNPNENGGNPPPCEGTICSNPNHGAGTDPNENGGAVMPNPNGDGQAVPCEGTICTNPNHGAGTDPDANGGDDTGQ
jgi:hypothetical protein